MLNLPSAMSMRFLASIRDLAIDTARPSN